MNTDSSVQSKKTSNIHGVPASDGAPITVLTKEASPCITTQPHKFGTKRSTENTVTFHDHNSQTAKNKEPPPTIYNSNQGHLIRPY
jgi:hypothetical protein